MADKAPNPETQRQAVKILRSTIDRLLDRDPFFGHILDQLKLAPDANKEHTTICTNGRVLSFSSQWVVDRYEDSGPAEMLTIMAHEASHIAFGHPYRLGEKDADTYNKATDAVINDILLDRGYTLPDDSFCYPNARTMTSEQLYKILMQQSGGGVGRAQGQEPNGTKTRQGQDWGGTFDPSDQTGQDQGQGRGQDQKPGQGEAPSDGEAEGEVREGVAKAAQKARKAGNMPGAFEKMIDQSLQSIRDWKDELKKFLGGGQLREPTWSKPNRRYVHEGNYLPGNGKFGPGEIVLAVDVSGSINNNLLQKFLAEVRKINEDLQPDAIHVLTCDTHIPWSETFGPYDDVDVPARAVTGGGTAFSPVFRWVDEQGIEPRALVYFTDLECSDFGPQPDYPALWIVWPGGRTSAPWGEIVEMDE